MSGSSSVLQKLPPHVARELRRHISPKPLVSPFSKEKPDFATLPPKSPPPLHHRMVFIGCTALTALAGCTPLLLYYWINPLNERDAPLTTPQNRRGPFQNSGSKDVGRDTDWDFKTGTHRLKAGYGNLDDDDDATTANKHGTKQKAPLPAEFLAMAPNDMKKVEDKIEAFAKGRGRNN